jgi:DNA replication and repair protein RecF
VNFRNYADATALLAPGLNVVVGDNAQGKTNLLEAIAFNVAGSSPRTPKENEVVRWGSDFSRTEARIAIDGSSEERSAAIGYAPGQKKRITVDGARGPASSRSSPTT